MAATRLFTSRSVPSRRSTSVNVVAAISSENSAPVIAMASCSSSRNTAPRSRPLIRPALSKVKAPIAAASTA